MRLHSSKVRPVHAGRRRFLQTLSAGITAGVAAPAIPQAQADPTVKIGREAVKGAEELAGLAFTDAEERMMLPYLERNLESFEALRAVAMAPDLEPALSFRPGVPDRRPVGRSTPNAPLTLSRPATIRIDPSAEELAFLPVTAPAALIEARRISSTDLTKLYLDRLKRFGDRFKCIVTLTEELALAQAAEADREIRAGRYRGPLHGIPWGAKDLFATRGIPTTWGAKPYERRVIDVDATVVERLRDAGAVLVARLSLGALAQGDVWFGGLTRNPWDDRTGSSGSSAGSAAATAAGLVGFSVGTETHGSIMSPSSTCGVTGLRPTYGRVSRYGATMLSWSMDKVGPICRSVEDCALVFNAIYGDDGRDETVVDAPFRWEPDVPLATRRIGFVKKEFEEPWSGGGPEQPGRWKPAQRVLSDALGVFRQLGARLEPIELPAIPAGALNIIQSAEAAASFDDFTRSRGIDRLTARGPEDWPNTFRTSRFIPAVEYIRPQRIRKLLTQKMDAIMSRYDVFLSPARSGSLALTNLTGHPALALTAGFVRRLPQAIMITGRLYDEATLLRVGLAYEQATRWHGMHPKLG